MTQEQIQIAYNKLNRKGLADASTYLSSIEKTLCDFADVLKRQRGINDDLYFKICGKYPPPPPDPQREKAYAEWANALASNQMNVHQIFGTYPYADDPRYHQAASNWLDKQLQQGRLTADDIVELYNKGILNIDRAKAELIKKGHSTDEIIDILGISDIVVSIPPELYPDPLVMTAEKTDVLLIGNKAAGKTMFLASFLYYLQETLGSIQITNEIPKSNDYAQLLISAIARNKILDHTEAGKSVNIPLIIRRTRKLKKILNAKTATYRYPLNLTDISGETYQLTLDNGVENLPKNLEEITFSQPNPKIFFFTLPVGEYMINYKETIIGDNGELNTREKVETMAGFYSRVLSMLHRYGALNKAIAVGIIVTKWDKAESEGFSSTDDFINKKCKVLEQTILDLQYRDGNQYSYQKFEYAIADDIDEDKNRYKHKPKGDEQIYDWLTNNAYQL